VSYKLAVPSQP